MRNCGCVFSIHKLPIFKLILFFILRTLNLCLILCCLTIVKFHYRYKLPPSRKTRNMRNGKQHNYRKWRHKFNPLKPELNPICYLLALLANNFLHVSRIRVKSLTFRRLMSYIYIYIYIYGAPILDVSRSHTTTQHSR